jgi:hypothetical protein
MLLRRIIRCFTAARWVRIRVRLRVVSTGLRQGFVQLVAIDAGIVERVPAAPMRQRQLGRHPDVGLLDRVDPTPGGVRGRRAGHHQIGPHAVDAERRAQRRNTS